ncbi:hypothetical protein JHK82_027622 [Glycine max]|nr:hypothetical protein JHK82_027622 [Glycine max]
MELKASRNSSSSSSLIRVTPLASIFVESSFISIAMVSEFSISDSQALTLTNQIDNHYISPFEDFTNYKAWHSARSYAPTPSLSSTSPMTRL